MSGYRLGSKARLGTMAADRGNGRQWKGGGPLRSFWTAHIGLRGSLFGFTLLWAVLYSFLRPSSVEAVLGEGWDAAFPLLYLGVLAARLGCVAGMVSHSPSSLYPSVGAIAMRCKSVVECVLWTVWWKPEAGVRWGHADISGSALRNPVPHCEFALTEMDFGKC